MSRILVVDDEPSICWGLSRLARSMGHRVDAAASAEEGLTLASVARPDLLVLDVRLPGMDGLTAMESFRRHIGAAPIIVMTAFGDLDTAVSAVAKGAFEYIVKPFDLAEIRAALERALRQLAPTGEPPRRAEPALDGMLGASATMRTAFKRLALAAGSDAPVLISGETGVGKELAARAIHLHSRRSAGPFIAVNFAGLSAVRCEAELFGHAAVPGSADTPAQVGALAQADRGTLFLDEPADLAPALQAKLVRALDLGAVMPVGGGPAASSDFRLIAATQGDLQAAVAAGAFRHDLYQRLATFPIPLPPLRDRDNDVELLARHFAAEANGDRLLSPELLEELRRRPWHGNVRELRRAIQHALVVARTGAVLPEHLPAPLPPLASPIAPADEPGRLESVVVALAKTLLEDPAKAGGVYDFFLHEVEPPLLAAALSRHGNRCAPAARALGLHRTTLKRKLDQYGLDDAGGD